MAGSAATGVNNGPISPGIAGDKNVIDLQWDWTSDSAAGTVDALGAIKNISGTVIGYKAVPGSGATQPTDLYDVTIKDASGATVVTASNNSNAANTRAVIAEASRQYLRDDTLTFSVAAAGNSKTGTFHLFVRLE